MNNDVYKGINIKYAPYEVQNELLKDDGQLIRYLDIPSEEQCILSVQQFPRSIFHIRKKNRTIKVIIEAILNDLSLYSKFKQFIDKKQLAYIITFCGHAKLDDKKFILNLDQSDEDMMKLCIKHNYNVLSYIKNPSYELQKFAVSENGYSIQYIENPSEELQLIAVRENEHAFQYIKNLTPAAQVEVARRYPSFIHYVNFDVCDEAIIEAMQRDPDIFEVIKKPSKQIQLLAIKLGACFGKYNFKDPEIIMALAEHNPELLEYCTPSFEAFEKVFNNAQEYVVNFYNIKKFLKYMEENIEKINTPHAALYLYNNTKKIETKMYLKLKFASMVELND